ncbi:MAG: efflux RND transporter permease subunit, partial [Alphaproteobacteria bacterium]
MTRITSWTRDEQASVRLEFALGHDLEAAANDVRDRVSRVVSSLPEGAGTPRIAKADSDANAMLYMSLSSPRRDNRALTDLAERFVVDRLSAVPGVASVSIGGDQRLAMRVWLDRQAMAARQITVADIEQALRRGNVELPAGRLESQAREFAVRTDVRLRGAEDFANLVIRDEGSTQLRLGDVAQVELGAYELRSETRINGATAIGLGVVRQSGANALAVSDGIQREVEEIRQTLPDDVIVRIGYDESVFVRSSINEVVRALLVALALVVAVIFIFLRSLRATLIPAVAIPVSIIATLPVLAALGFSINVLTLLALVLAIGLVVDDAIVVLENIHRRVEDGEAPLLGAQRGARQITFAVISTTLVLVAVFVPISFMQGATGRLFTEFGIAMAAAVVFSSFVALTLTPMMASRLLAAGGGGRADAGQRAFRGIARAYGRSVEFALGQPVIVIGIAVLISALAVSLFQNIDRDFAPSEDRGVFFVSINAPEGSSLDYTRRQVAAAEAILTPLVDRGDVESVYTLLAPSFSGPSQVNRAFIVLRLNDWGSGRASQQDLIAEVRPQLSALPGMRAFVFPPRTLGQRAPSDSLEMVLGGADTLTLQDWSERLIARIESDTGGITGLSTNWAEGKPEIRLRVDRRRAADLGVDLAEIGRTLEVMIGGRAITRFPDRGQEYDVLLQAAGV